MINKVKMYEGQEGIDPIDIVDLTDYPELSGRKDHELYPKDSRKSGIYVVPTRRQLDPDITPGDDINTAKFDKHRLIPKRKGGTYTKENTRLLNPVTHLETHGNLRTREEYLDTLKTVFDDRVQSMKLKLKINNQLLAYERRTDRCNPETVEHLHRMLEIEDDNLKKIDKELAKLVKKYPDALSQAALGVPGIGPITVAALAVYVDLNKANTPSALFKYAGIDVPSHERYTKGETSGGNKTLRTVLWNTACTMVKLGEGNKYRKVYDEIKGRLEISERVTKTRTTQGKLVECAWKDVKPGHRHGTGLRAVMRHLLSDYWFVGREIMGLSTRPPYAIEYLGHTKIISPKERGWVWEKGQGVDVSVEVGEDESEDMYEGYPG